MKEEFKYGEKVKARDRDDEPWQDCYFIAKAERDGTSFYITVLEEENVKLPNFDEFLTCCWYQIRKVQPEETTNEKETLEKIFEFETYCTARFDSEHRVAMAVYDYVKQMKREFNIKGDE